jgi:hypothetical protein
LSLAQVDHNILKCVNLKGKASLNLIEANFLNKYQIFFENLGKGNGKKKSLTQKKKIG